MKLVILWYYLLTSFLNSFVGRRLAPMLLRTREKKLRRFVCRRSAFFKANGFVKMDKSVMMENFDEINTVGMRKTEAFKVALKAEKDPTVLPEIGGVTVGMSTGTSGNRGLFLATGMERAKWAGIILAKLLPRPIFAKQSICLFLRNNSKLYETLDSKILSFSYYPLSTSFDLSLVRISKENPNIIVAPPSILVKLAREQLSGRLRLNPLRIISAAEVLTGEDKSFIERAFEQPLHEIYQCTEGFLAATCSHGNLHLNEEFIVFGKKWLNDDKTRFSPVITDTLRFSQPVINYELNDILVVDHSSCPCGSRNLRIKQIEGRSDDIFRFGKTEIFPDYIRRAVVSSSETIQNYLVAQKSGHEVELSVLSDNSQDVLLAKEALEELFRSKAHGNVNVSIRDYVAPRPENKFRRVISSLN